MKGDENITGFIYVLIVVIIVALVLVTYFGPGAKEEDIASITPEPSGGFGFEYNYAAFSVESSQYDEAFEDAASYHAYFSSDKFCTKVKEAIKRAILTGKEQDVDIVIYKGSGLNDISIKDIYPDLSSCEEEQLNVSLGDGTWHDICYYDPRGTSIPGTYVQGNMIYVDYTQSNGLDYAHCNFTPFSEETVDKKISTISSQYGGITDDEEDRLRELFGTEIMPGNWLTLRYICTDYLQHYDSAYGTGYNGPGRMRIKIGKAKVDSEGECKFTTRLCMEPAFAEYQSDQIFRMFDIFRKVEVVRRPDIGRYYVRLTSNNTDYLLDDSDFVIWESYRWNRQYIELDKEYSALDLSEAIITGFARNVNQYFWTSDTRHWYISKHDYVNVTGCTTGPASGISGDKTIAYNCDVHGDSKCEGTVGVDIGITMRFKEGDDIPYITTCIFFEEVD